MAGGSARNQADLAETGSDKQMLTWAIIGVLWVAVINQHDYRLRQGVLFMAIITLHAVIGTTMIIDDIYYYISAGIASWIGLKALNICKTTRLRDELKRIGASMLAGNILGLALWYFYAPSEIYDAVFIALYALAIFAFIRPDTEDGYSHSQNHSRYSCSGSAADRRTIGLLDK